MQIKSKNSVFNNLSKRYNKKNLTYYSKVKYYLINIDLINLIYLKLVYNKNFKHNFKKDISN